METLHIQKLISHIEEDVVICEENWENYYIDLYSDEKYNSESDSAISQMNLYRL